MKRTAPRFRVLSLLALTGSASVSAAPQATPQPEAGAQAAPMSLTPGNPLRRVEIAPRRVDQGIADRNALSASLYSTMTRVDPLGRVGWAQVYESRTRDGRRVLMRYDGALGASFPYSEYALVEDDDEHVVEIPVTPAGTVFHIGPHADDVGGIPVSSDPMRPRSPLQVINRIDPRSNEPMYTPLTPHVETLSLDATIADDAYRAKRLRELLRLAALGEQSQSR